MEGSPECSKDEPVLNKGSTCPHCLIGDDSVPRDMSILNCSYFNIANLNADFSPQYNDSTGKGIVENIL